MLVQIVPEWLYLIPRPTDKYTVGGRPSVEVNGDEMTQLFARPLPLFVRPFHAKKQIVIELTR